MLTLQLPPLLLLALLSKMPLSWNELCVSLREDDCRLWSCFGAVEGEQDSIGWFDSVAVILLP
jgi:hypothetical protein